MGSLERSRMFERGRPPPEQEGTNDGAPRLVEKVVQLLMTRRERERRRELK